MRTGFTLLEISVVLALLALAGTAVVPAARRTADAAAVVGAREAVAGLVVRARSEAMLLGGASLHARAADATVWVEADDSVVALRRLGAEFGVTLELGAAEAELPFDALGIGRRASRTLALRRGTAEARLVVAAYGRAVRS
jgi:prepilin-type N-terminal cleavage/methylation domain-containing protein